jgi:hypothetical protein
MAFWGWFWLAVLAILMVGVLATAIAETVRSIRIGAGRTTRIRRAKGKAALWLIPLVGTGHSHGHGDGDAGDGGDGGVD